MQTRFERRQLPYDAYSSENLTFLPHIHPHIEIVCGQEGELEMAVEDHQTLLRAGEMAIVFPNVLHSYRTEAYSRAFFLIAHPVLIGEYSRVFSALRPRSPFLGAAEIGPEIRWALERLEKGRPGDIGDPLRRGYLLVLLGELMERLKLEKIPEEQPADLLRRLLAYLDEHFREPLRLETLARALHVSRYHLSRCFSQRIGTGFNAYLGALRANYARTLLAGDALTITEICYEAGFESVNTFYRAFRSCYGFTPGEYRRASERERDAVQAGEGERAVLS